MKSSLFARAPIAAVSITLALACASSGNDTLPSSPPAPDAATSGTDDGKTDGGGKNGPDGGATNEGGGPTGPTGPTSPTSEGGTSTPEAGPAGPGSYALDPPKQCDNQFFVPGCTAGDSTTACGGVCAAQSACESTKPNNPDIGFLCPRFILLGDEMEQAAKDDFGDSPPFHYAIVGHDPDTTLDQNGNGGSRSCCQCYQLVYVNPSENEADVSGTNTSAVPVPPPLIVQAFNTAAGGGKNFDVYMGAGGFGGNNACDPNFTQQTSASGKYLYTKFPEVGEGGNGGEKAAQIQACKTNENLITTDTLSSSACQGQIQTDCDTIAATSAAVTSETIQSCIGANAPDTYYHINWNVYAKKVECPTHLTQVTGCELAPQGLPAANPSVTTAAQAGADSSFLAGYTTTTMQDCCKPTCAWQDNVKMSGATVGMYNSFYSCDGSGVPVTE